jgi:hypothetical protein
MTHLFDLQVDWIDDIADSAARLAKVRIVTQASSIRTRLTGSRLQRAEPAGVQGGGIIPCGAYLCADDELWAELRHDDRLAIPALRDLHRSGCRACMLSCGACADCAGRPRCGDRGVLYVSKPLSPRHRLPLTGRHFARRRSQQWRKIPI